MARRREGPPRWLQAARAAGKDRPTERPDWLSRAMARAGLLPLAQAEAAIRAGQVKLHGKVVHEPLTPVRPKDSVVFAGRTHLLEARTRVLMFHKRAGEVTSTVDPEGEGTVFEQLALVLPPELRSYGWHAVGRLDRDTTGLLLFTNDERLVAHATAPATHLPKRYVAKVQGTASDPKLTPLRKGLCLDDGPARPAQAKVRADGQVELVLTEGRYHQVKRMLAAVGLPVMGLHREAVGELELDVPAGQYRELGEEEVRAKLGFEGRAK